MKFKIVLFFLFSIILLQNKIFAQPQLWEVYTTSKQLTVDVTIEKYESDSLYVKYMNQLIILHQDSIKYLIKRKESEFGLGFLFGAIAGGIVGAASSSDSDGTGKGFNVLFGAVLGGLIGGFFGLAVGTDEKYPIEKLEPDHKRAVLNSLFN